MPTRPTGDAAESALKTAFDLLKEHRFRSPSDQTERRISKELKIVRSYCPMIGDWGLFISNNDAFDITVAVEILHYYASLSAEHSLLDRARVVLDQICRDYPFIYDPKPIPAGLDELIGLGVPGFGPSYLQATPRNCLFFFDTGGDGVHYTFLGSSQGIDDTSPIVQIEPVGYDPQVVAGDLLEFLQLGLAAGTWFNMAFCHRQSKVGPPATGELLPRLDAFAGQLDLTPQAPSPQRLAQLNDQHASAIMDPWL